MTDAFVHPVTGELIPADQAALEAAAKDTDEEVGRLYRALDPIRVRLAELRGPAVLPRPSRRSDVQVRVGRCPRCGGRELAV